MSHNYRGELTVLGSNRRFRPPSKFDNIDGMEVDANIMSTFVCAAAATGDLETLAKLCDSSTVNLTDYDGRTPVWGSFRELDVLTEFSTAACRCCRW